MLELWVPPSNEGVPTTSPEVLENPRYERWADMTGAHSVHGWKWKTYRTSGRMKSPVLKHEYELFAAQRIDAGR